MDLTDRKLKILEAIISDYIFVAEPLGSRTLSKRHDLGISAATIRNEMSDLEDMGYLTQPHTSSGRIPTELGYRLYVESMMKDSAIDGYQKKLIDDSMYKGYGEIQNILDEALRLMSSFTRYTAIGITPRLNHSKLKNIQLVQVNNNTVLVILVMDNGLIRNITVNTKNQVCQETLTIISSILNENLLGREISDSGKFAIYLKDCINEYSSLIDEVFELVHMNILTLEDTSVIFEGITNIFEFPEFNDITKAKAFMGMFEEKRPVIDMLNSQGISRENINIIIGNENTCEIAKECSLLTATYTLNGSTIGKIGIIGPTRMDYTRVFSIMSYISKSLNDFIKNNF